MNPKLIREVGRSQRLDILTALKRRGGMSVKELANLFRMSYMGIKGHCLDLERDGYLQTWRRPGDRGRPELLYRLTLRAHELFPSVSHELTADILEAVQQTYGPAAPTKLLFVVFAQRAETYRAQIAADAALANGASSLAQRAESLARLRDAEGYMAEFRAANGPYPGFFIVEHHSPLADLARRYPILARLERELFERTLDCTVQREEQAGQEGYCCIYSIGAEN